MQCPRCQHVHSPNANFCEGCGTPLKPARPADPDLNDEVDGLRRALREALEQQTATAEILRVISSSPTDVRPVFDAIAETAARLCESFDAAIYRPDGDRLVLVAHHGAIPLGPIGDFSIPFVRGTVAGQSLLSGRTVHVADAQTESDEFPQSRHSARQLGFRTILCVPLMREGVAVGTFSLRRTEVQLFTDRQVALLETFAKQAVIAIEHVRLFKELQEKNEALTQAHAQVSEALEQQTATSDILRVISQSPTDVQPVFDAIAESAARLCGSLDAHVFRRHGDLLHLVAHHGSIPIQFTLPLVRGTANGRAVLDGRPVHVVDMQTQVDDFPEGSENARRMGHRTTLNVPLMREGVAIGAIGVRRTEALLFTDRQVALLHTFADQAVIAIENVRLFNETKEALEQQTATSEILRVISSSPTDVQPVFDTIAERAVRLCDGLLGGVYRFDGELIHFVAHHNWTADGLETVQRMYPRLPSRDTQVSAAILDGAVVEVRDFDDPGVPRTSVPLARALGYRSILVTPMLRQGDPIGAIAVARAAPGPFSPEEIALLKTFADQAVIAIENVRLFTELQENNLALTEAHAHVTEALEQQTATAEILRVISRSQTDVQPVFDTIVRSAVSLCGGLFGTVFQFDGELLHFVAQHNYTSEALEEVHRVFPMRPTRGFGSGRAIFERAVVHIPDMEVDPEYQLQAESRVVGFRSGLSVPMLREGAPIGVIWVARAEPGPFSDTEIALLQTFADQAVIAIENVRLFKELEARNRDLTDSLKRETATGEILRVISSSPTDIQPVLVAILHSGRRLCDAAFGAIFRFEDGVFVNAVSTTVTSEFGAWLQKTPIQPGPGTPLRRIGLERRSVQVADILSDPEFAPPVEYRREGMRTALAVPMFKDGVLLGALTFHRRIVKPFTDQEIGLLETFAAQAVIAIENVRLFKELEEKNLALTRAHTQVTEALEQQTATGEVLKVISRSAFDLQPVFDTMAENAVRLCEAERAFIFRFDGELLRAAASYNVGPEVRDFVYRNPVAPGRHSISARAALERRTVHIPDVQADPDYAYAARDVDLIRTMLAVPMLKGDTLVGTITIYRLEVKPFTDKQVALVETFADQAVIAIENVRLFTELEARNKDLTEALDQQTATSEILKVIASSPTDYRPVFETIVHNAASLCASEDAVLFLLDGAEMVVHAQEGAIGGAIGDRPPIEGTVGGRTISSQRVVHIEDLAAADEFQAGQEICRRFGHRTILSVPLVREGVALGAIMIRRTEVRPFSDQQVALLQTFADQAVIAIENVRLFTELQTSNRELTTALDTQTATSDILRVISRSQTNVQPVFDAILGSAVRLLRGYSGVMTRLAGDQIELAALTSTDDAGDAATRAAFPQSLQSGEPSAQAMRDRAPINITDAQTDPRASEAVRANARARGNRSWVIVPLLRHDEAVGTLAVTRREPGGFTDDEIALLKTFADQAVIAIENARLLTELQARTQELSRSVGELQALGEVGQAISSTLDLETVLTTIVSRAVQLSALDGGVVFEYDEGTEEFVQRAGTDPGGALAEARRSTRIRKGEGVLGRTAITLEPIQVPDITVPAAYEGRLREILVESGVRAILAVPMVREGRLIGCLGVTRNRPGEFPAETIELLRTFATQSALAIQNARLFHEIADKSRQLEAASRHKSEFLANMSHELRTPLNAIIGFSEVLAEKMFGDINDKQAEYLQDILESGRHLLSLINDILDLSKIEAGRMELELAEFDLPRAIENALTLVRERALRRGIALDHVIHDRVADIRADERKVKQVLLNLLSNAIKFTPEGGRIDVRAAPADGLVEVSVTDSGVGIAPEDQEAVFEEFRQVGTTDKKAEGTGLGLALSRRFIELHGGQISVQSEIGHGSTFTFTLPVRP